MGSGSGVSSGGGGCAGGTSVERAGLDRDLVGDMGYLLETDKGSSSGSSSSSSRSAGSGSSISGNSGGICSTGGDGGSSCSIVGDDSGGHRVTRALRRLVGLFKGRRRRRKACGEVRGGH